MALKLVLQFFYYLHCFTELLNADTVEDSNKTSTFNMTSVLVYFYFGKKLCAPGIGLHRLVDMIHINNYRKFQFVHPYGKLSIQLHFIAQLNVCDHLPCLVLPLFNMGGFIASYILSKFVQSCTCICAYWFNTCLFLDFCSLQLYSRFPFPFMLHCKVSTSTRPS